MRIVFLGFQTWGLVSLKTLVEDGHDVVLVITHPRTDVSVEKSFNDSIYDYATKQRIPVLVQSSFIVELLLE